MIRRLSVKPGLSTHPRIGLLPLIVCPGVCDPQVVLVGGTRTSGRLPHPQASTASSYRRSGSCGTVWLWLHGIIFSTSTVPSSKGTTSLKQHFFYALPKLIPPLPTLQDNQTHSVTFTLRTSLKEVQQCLFLHFHQPDICAPNAFIYER